MCMAVCVFLSVCFLCVVFFLCWVFCVCDVCSLGTSLFVAYDVLCVLLCGVLRDWCVCGWSCVACCVLGVCLCVGCLASCV